jgi:DNA modification methylase
MTQKNLTDERLLVGNCLETLKNLPDESIDSVVTDPPYELGFMGKSWDSTGIAFNTAVWQECLRVLKPGGHLLAFSGSRTYHRMAVAIEDAGFEIRDQIMWLYGSGFPKSLAIDKAIDKAAKAERKVIGTRKAHDIRSGNLMEASQGKGKGTMEYEYTAPATKEAKQWQGWGTALKPAHEPIVVARKPLIGTVAETVLKYGTGGINIDASRVGTTGARNNGNSKGTVDSNSIGVYGKAIKQDYNMGRFPANVILTHNHDCQETGTVTDDITLNGEGNDKMFHGKFNGGQNQSPKQSTTTTWSCTPGCPATQFPNSKGALAPVKSGQKGFGGEIYNKYNTAGDDGATFYNDGEGTAARFFYCAKASKKERNGGLDGLTGKSIGAKGNGLARVCDKCSTPQLQGCECIDNSYINPTRQNFHPTVKPLELMKYLIKLVTPPKGTVLDPFLGSGSTAVAAVLEGFEWKGCEMTDDYLPIIKARVKWAEKEVKKKAKQETLPLENKGD